MLRNAELVCDAAEVTRAIEKLAESISGRLSGAYPLVLTVMGGAVFFAGQLLPRLRFPLDQDYIHASRYGDSIAGSDIRWRVHPPESVRGRTVLVLDDILDGGNTLAAIRERILAQGATEFFSAVLTEKMHGTEKAAKADFVGLHIPNRFVFGCGMDARGHWRNLPEIYALKEA